MDLFTESSSPGFTFFDNISYMFFQHDNIIYIYNIMKLRTRSSFSSFHYWASEKLFLFVFNESIRRVVDKSSELNKRSILPYRTKWNWMLPAPDLSSLKLTSLEPDKTGVEMGLAVSMLARWSRYKVLLGLSQN